MASVLVVGAKGRMGTLLRAAVEADANLSLAGGYDADNISELDSVAPTADLVIDFSAPASLPHVEAYVRRTHAALLSGTTGLSAEDLSRIEALGQVAPVIWSGNYSLGVAVLRHLAREAAASLTGWDTEIVECHHNRKADAPSGTALMLADAVKSQRPDAEYVYGRSGQHKRQPNEIGIHSLRMGNVVGEHEVIFATDNQTITLKHQAHDRALFAEGALTAAGFLVGQPAGFYHMDDLLGP